METSPKISAVSKTRSGAKLPPRKIELDVYDEVVGEIKGTKVVGGLLTLLIEIPRESLEVEFPRQLLYGEVPPPGTLIGLLRTRSDYRIKVETEDEEKLGSADSVPTNPSPVSNSSAGCEQVHVKRRSSQK